MMKKTIAELQSVIIMTLFMLMMAPAVRAYTSADFNRIKLDQKFLYEESTLDSEEEARQTAHTLLISHINRYFRENSIDRTLTPESDIDVQFMTMPRGKRTRVMAYIAKSDLTSTSRKKSPAPGATVSDDVPEMPQWQTEIIDRLKESGNLSAATKLLKDYKSIYKIKNYGTIKECLNARSCYWVVCNSKLEITAVLGPDTDTDRRFNFMTGKFDSLGNYSAQYGAWFQFR